MTMVFLFAIGSSFAFKSKAKQPLAFSYFIGGNCYLAFGNSDQSYCDVSYTGAQCTYQGVFPIYFYDVNTALPPTCITPLLSLIHI